MYRKCDVTEPKNCVKPMLVMDNRDNSFKGNINTPTPAMEGDKSTSNNTKKSKCSKLRWDNTGTKMILTINFDDISHSLKGIVCFIPNLSF